MVTGLSLPRASGLHGRPEALRAFLVVSGSPLQPPVTAWAVGACTLTEPVVEQRTQLSARYHLVHVAFTTARTYTSVVSAIAIALV